MGQAVALVGNPNCGKTTLFNELTGSNQYVGNWAGVTVEKKVGKIRGIISDMDLVDLPGIYSLSPYTMEEVVSRNFIIDEAPAAIINIIDGTNIERNLYLSIQVMELNIPMVIAVNMMDDVRDKGETIDCEMLSTLLGVPVMPIVARHNDGIDELVKITEALVAGTIISSPKIVYDNNTQVAINDVIELIADNAKYIRPHVHETIPAGADDDTSAELGRPPIDHEHNIHHGHHRHIPLQFYAGKLLESDIIAIEDLQLDTKQKEVLELITQRYEATTPYGDRDSLLADARYTFIMNVVAKAVVKNTNSGHMTLSDKIDAVVTNRILAIPIFLLIMFTMFSLTFSGIGVFFTSLIKKAIEFISMGATSVLDYAAAPQWIYGLILDAIIGGVGGILTFLPQIMILFLFLSILEDSGYMSRAAFIMDRPLRKLGLTGKSFIPMLMGFGCTTPAVMAARAMENDKDRKLTIMLTPFMSCGAKLPIYALFAGVFFSENQGFIVFSMYILGLIIAIIAGLFLKNTLFKGNVAPFIMELPTYRMPTLKSTAMHLWDKCRGFLIKAGTIIFSMSIVIWLLQNFTLQLEVASDSASSIFGQFGALISPIFAPLGFGTWQASVALLTGLVAKEAVVSTMGVLYSGSGVALSTALATVFTPASALSFMTFTLLYMPCISAFVSIRREMGSTKWAVGSAIFQTTIAYFVAMIVYQLARIIM